MPRGNDAIPSWSGFNYQGKIMLLCIMEKINSIILSGKDLSEYEVELELQEDFVFIEKGKSRQFYQVKATLSRSKWNEYEEALEKLINHRNSSNNASADCYFVVARPISDWTSSTNPYKSSVNIYKYNSNEVEVDGVKGPIYTEIEKILHYKGIKFKNIEAIYGSLCIFIDDKVALMHTQGAKERKYKIGFSEFLKTALDAVDKIDAEKEYVIKEKAYEHMIAGLKKSLIDLCQKKCHRKYEDCESKCALKTSYKKILELTDLRKYCKVINPSVVEEWDDEMSYVEYFSKSKIKQYILGIFLESNNSELIESKENTVGMRSEINPLSQGILIPTLLDLAEPFDSIEDSMQNKLQTLRENTEVLDELIGNSITVESNDYFNSSSISQAQITSAWETFDIKEISSIPCDIGFVTVSDLRNYFKENGGNYE
ncbi:MAG: hypothetical protein J1F18_07525 [Lachnospiraceae bacterium]|nr:hypothetical protein [Lachnospiraceae bacterium]